MFLSPMSLSADAFAFINDDYGYSLTPTINSNNPLPAVSTLSPLLLLEKAKLFTFALLPIFFTFKKFAPATISLPLLYHQVLSLH